jgi:cell division protein FtsQ
LGVGAAGAAWKWRVPLARATACIHLGRAHVTVSGLEYLSPAEVLQAAGLSATEPFFGLDLERARRRLLRHPRVRTASVERRLNGELAVVVRERLPVALVHCGRLAEVDADGRVLPPLVGGEVPDLPVVTGLAAPVEGWVRDSSFARAVRWVRALGSPEVGLLERVSELDVGAAQETRVVMSPTGVRVLLPAEPDDVEQLSAVRVVLADLAAKGRRAALIDCRARGQAVVEGEDRPVGPAARAAGTDGAGAPAAPPRA